MSVARACAVAGCGRPAAPSRSWCHGHASRASAYGSVTRSRCRLCGAFYEAGVAAPKRGGASRCPDCRPTAV